MTIIKSDSASLINDPVYTQLLNRKKSWTPPETSNESTIPGTELALDRALCLRGLEIPVGEFIKQGCAKEDNLSKNCLDLLLSNIADEEKHDISLNKLYTSAGLHIKEHETVAEQIVQKWLDLPDHPFVKALYGERSVFFVILPMFRFLSGQNFSMRTVASEISGDEVVHVSTNTRLCRQLKLSPSDELNTLRRDTIAWVVEHLTGELRPETSKIDSKYFNADFWIKQSDNLYYDGVAPELSQTQAARMPAMFESSRQQQSVYN
jgi:hypothetical protein